MNRRTRTLIVLGVAVLTAALASLGIYKVVKSLPTKEVEVPKAFVVVAAQPLELGVRLTEDHVKVVPWPARSPVAGAFSKIEDVVDRGLVTSVGENEAITETKLAPKDGGSGIPIAIKLGSRAMSVKVNEVIGVAGFVVPGSHVDVLVTIRKDSESTTRVVLSNIQVLTAGTRFDESQAKKEGKAIPSSVVTLMVTPPEAERIALASTEGQIMLALRNPLDTASPSTSGVKTGTLLTAPIVGSEAPKPKPRPSPESRVVNFVPIPIPPPAQPGPWTIATIKAGKRDVETVQ